jgi:hypothetical protein
MAMRRILAIFLIAAFGLPVAASALALAQDSGSSHLPACCRRNGAHHCGMLAASKGAPAVSATCPSFPQPSTTAPAANSAALIPTAPATLLHLTSFTAAQRAEAQRRLSRERSRHKRGPPTVRLS